jgi:DNA-binding response OmpR family regulator
VDPKRPVIVVDDYEDSLELLCEALADAGLEPRPFRDPIAALFDLLDSRPELILLDWHLPRIGGQDFVSQVRRRAHLREVPIVVITGDTRVSSTNGVQALLIKPIELPALVATVSRLLPQPALALARQ